jgi:hypothetical protein
MEAGVADVSPLPTVGSPTSLFPQPQAQQQSALTGNPTQMLDLLTKIQQNYALQQELKAKAAMGQVYQGAIQPDGTFDPNKLAGGLRNNPDAAWGLPDAMTRVQQQQGNQLDLVKSQNQWVVDRLGSLADNPNATAEDVRHFVVDGARQGIPAPVLQQFSDAVIHDPRGLQYGLKQAQAQAIGSAGLAQRQQGPPTGAGAPATVSTGQTLWSNPAGMPTGLSGDQARSVEHMNADQQRQSNYKDEMYQWEQAYKAAQDLKTKYGAGAFGPGTAARREYESFAYSFAPGLATMTGIANPEQLKDYDNAKKYLTQAMQSRASALGIHTNEGLASTIGASPNVNMNDLSVDELIRANMALRRAEYTQVDQATKAGGPSYTSQKAKLASQYDIRAFGFDLMPQDEQRKILTSLKPGSPEYKRFNASLAAGHEAGVMDWAPPGATPAAAAPSAAPAARPARAAPATPAPVAARSAAPLPGYTANGSQSLADIATLHGRTPEELLAANPAYADLVRGGTMGLNTRLPQGVSVAVPPGSRATRSIEPAPVGTTGRSVARPAAPAPASEADALRAARAELARRLPPPGARLGRDVDGSPAHFVPDPNRPGKYMKVIEAQ